MDTPSTYTCKSLWTATWSLTLSDWNNTNLADNPDSTLANNDTIQNRMRWLTKHKTSATDYQNIDWIIWAKPPSTSPIPSLFIADCIDWTKDLWTDMTYTHIDGSTESIAYSLYNTNNATSTDSDWRSNVIYQNRHKYLLWWTQQSWWHLPSAFSYITSWFASASNIDWQYLTWIDRWEYQVACNLWVFVDSDSVAWVNIRSSAIWNTVWVAWWRAWRLVWANWCDTQTSNNETWNSSSSISTRFVIRP